MYSFFVLESDVSVPVCTYMVTLYALFLNFLFISRSTCPGLLHESSPMPKTSKVEESFLGTASIVCQKYVSQCVKCFLC